MEGLKTGGSHDFSLIPQFAKGLEMSTDSARLPPEGTDLSVWWGCLAPILPFPLPLGKGPMSLTEKLHGQKQKTPKKPGTNFPFQIIKSRKK